MEHDYTSESDNDTGVRLTRIRDVGRVGAWGQDPLTDSAASSVPFFQVVVPDPLAFPIENVVAVARIFFRIQLKFNSIWLVHLPHA